MSLTSKYPLSFSDLVTSSAAPVEQRCQTSYGSSFYIIIIGWSDKTSNLLLKPSCPCHFKCMLWSQTLSKHFQWYQIRHAKWCTGNTITNVCIWMNGAANKNIESWVYTVCFCSVLTWNSFNEELEQALYTQHYTLKLIRVKDRFLELVPPFFTSYISDSSTDQSIRKK